MVERKALDTKTTSLAFAGAIFSIALMISLDVSREAMVAGFVGLMAWTLYVVKRKD